MSIKYKTAKNFNDNSSGLTIRIDSKSLLIVGDYEDLVEFANLLVDIASSKDETAHIHIDDLTLLNKNSDFSEVIIEKKSN